MACSPAVAYSTPTRADLIFIIPMPTRRTQLQEDTHFRVLRILQDNTDLTQREIAERLGLSASGLNYCLKALIDRGWVKVQNFSQSKNKFGYIYVLTPLGAAEKLALTGRFLRRKMQEYDALKQEIEGLRAEFQAPGVESVADVAR